MVSLPCGICYYQKGVSVEMSEYIDYYSVEEGMEVCEETPDFNQAEKTAKLLAKGTIRKCFMIIKHTKVGEHMSETIHDRNISIVCEACGCTATVHTQGNAEVCFKSPACGREV